MIKLIYVSHYRFGVNEFRAAFVYGNTYDIVMPASICLFSCIDNVVEYKNVANSYSLIDS